MVIICPTVTAHNAHQFREQMERLIPFAHRVHIDCMDGILSPTKSPDLAEAWWPAGVVADMHVMYQRPHEHLDAIVRLKPDLVVLHAEADGNFFTMMRPLKQVGIKVGIALLRPTNVSTVADVVDQLDHALVFSGDLGHYGGHADLQLLEKVQQLKKLNPNLEIGWDGGINANNARQLVDGGVDVLNVGGFIQRAADPQKAYATLEAAIKQSSTWVN